MVGEGLRGGKPDPELEPEPGGYGERRVGDRGGRLWFAYWGDGGGSDDSMEVRGEAVGDASYRGGGTKEAFLAVGLPGVVPESSAA